MPVIYHTEEVKEGQKANWPNDPNYEEEKPVKEGYALKGWDYNWATDPIFEDTEIHPIWDKVTMQASTNVSGDISFNGDDLEDLGEFTELRFWASTLSGDLIHDGVDIQEVALQEGELMIDFIDYGDFVENGKNVRKIKVKENTDYQPRFYRFKAVTDNYGGMESQVIELRQEQRVDIYVLESENPSGEMTVSIDGGAINLSGYTSTLNDEYYDNLTFESNESWIQPSGVVTRQDPSDNIALIQATIQPLQVGYERVGRTTTILVKQNGDGGMTDSLEIEQIMPQETSSVTFILTNNSSNTVSFSSVQINLLNGRSFTFTPSTNSIASGGTFTQQVDMETYFFDKQINQSIPLQGTTIDGSAVSSSYLTINTTSLEEEETYTITYSPTSNNGGGGGNDGPGPIIEDPVFE